MVTASSHTCPSPHWQLTPTMQSFQFIQLADYRGGTYFSLNLSNAVSINVTHLRETENDDNIADYLFPFINITKRATGPFSSDLTARDDALLALLSLLILLLIEAIITTILLRRYQGLVTNFGFAAKQVIELVKDLNLRRVFLVRNVRNSFSYSHGQSHQKHHQQQQQPPLSKLNLRLLLLALSIFFLSFALEVAVFFLTNSYQRSVTNATATFRLRQPLTPDFVKALLHSRVSIHRPCEAITVQNVLQANTGINGCVDTDLDFSDTSLFALEHPLPNVTLRIDSRLHDYGADHFIQVGDINATYTQRALFSLGDARARVMASDATFPDEDVKMQIVHYQYVAYLFSLFNRDAVSAEDIIPLQRLQNLDIEWQPPESGESVDVLQLPGRPQPVPTRRYVTQVRGEIPHGVAALRLAQQYLKGMMGVVVAQGNTTDMFMDSGVESTEAVVWEESVRSVNWLSMGIITALGIVALVLLRWLLTPCSTADIAELGLKRRLKEMEAMSGGSETEERRMRFVIGAEVEEEEDERGEHGEGNDLDDYLRV